MSTNKIIDTKMRDRKENLLNKTRMFRSKLANITPKRIQNQVQAPISSANLEKIKSNKDYNELIGTCET